MVSLSQFMGQLFAGPSSNNFLTINPPRRFTLSKFSGTISLSEILMWYFSSRNAISSRIPVESMMPESRKDVSSPRPAASPNRKLLIMKSLISERQAIFQDNELGNSLARHFEEFRSRSILSCTQNLITKRQRKRDSFLPSAV